MWVDYKPIYNCETMLVCLFSGLFARQMRLLYSECAHTVCHGLRQPMSAEHAAYEIDRHKNAKAKYGKLRLQKYIVPCTRPAIYECLSGFNVTFLGGSVEQSGVLGSNPGHVGIFRCVYYKINFSTSSAFLNIYQISDRILC